MTLFDFRMKTCLRYLGFGLVALGIVGLAGSLTTRVFIKRNRDARSEYYAKIVEPAEKKQREDYAKQKAALESQAAKTPGSLPYLPIFDMTATRLSLAMIDKYDLPYFHLKDWELGSDAVTVGCILLIFYCRAALCAINAKESRSNQSKAATATAGISAAGQPPRQP